MIISYLTVLYIYIYNDRFSTALNRFFFFQSHSKLCIAHIRRFIGWQKLVYQKEAGNCRQQVASVKKKTACQPTERNTLITHSLMTCHIGRASDAQPRQRFHLKFVSPPPRKNNLYQMLSAVN